MEDKLKQWVAGQRDEFEVYDFEPVLSWEKIETGMQTQSVSAYKSKKLWYSVAASVAVLLIATVAFIVGQASNQQPADRLFAANQELADARDFYTSEINYKMNEARSLVNDQKVFEDIDELDKAFAALKDDLKDQADNEEVVVAMI
ncbi:MAG: hypothetical protein AAFO69_16400, partial [Bacteroidota bacterium]